MLFCSAWVDRSCQYFNIGWGNWRELCWLEYRNWVAEVVSPLQAIMTGAFYVISPLFSSFKANKMVERNMCVWQIIVMWLRLVISLYMQWYASCSWVEMVVMVKFFYGHLKIIKWKELLMTHSFRTIIVHKVTVITSVFLFLHLKADFQ